MRLAIASTALVIVAATPLSAEELTYRCKWVAGTLDRERDIDTLKINVSKQEIHLLISSTGDGWSYLNKGKQGDPDHWQINVQRDHRWITAHGSRYGIPAIIVLTLETGRLRYIYVSGEFTKQFEYSCAR